MRNKYLIKTTLALLTITAAVQLDAALFFESTTSVNRSTHQVTLNVSGPANQSITIERSSNPSMRQNYYPAASQYWSNIATLNLNGSGKGSATVDIHFLTWGRFSSLRYGVYRAYQPGSTNLSTNAFMALYGTYGVTNATDVFAHITDAKSIEDIIVNPHDGMIVYTMNSSGSYDSRFYDSFFGGWDPPSSLTINPGIGFMLYSNPSLSLSNVVLDFSGLFDEATVSVPIAASGFRILSGSQPASVIYYGPEYYGDPTSEIIGGFDSTTTLPVVDDSYVNVWDTSQNWWSNGSPNEYQSTLGGWTSVGTVRPSFGYLFRNASPTVVTWQFNREIW